MPLPLWRSTICTVQKALFTLLLHPQHFYMPLASPFLPLPLVPPLAPRPIPACGACVSNGAHEKAATVLASPTQCCARVVFRCLPVRGCLSLAVGSAVRWMGLGLGWVCVIEDAPAGQEGAPRSCPRGAAWIESVYSIDVVVDLTPCLARPAEADAGGGRAPLCAAVCTSPSFRRARRHIHAGVRLCVALHAARRFAAPAMWPILFVAREPQLLTARKAAEAHAQDAQALYSSAAAMPACFFRTLWSRINATPVRTRYTSVWQRFCIVHGDTSTSSTNWLPPFDHVCVCHRRGNTGSREESRQAAT